MGAHKDNDNVRTYTDDVTVIYYYWKHVNFRRRETMDPIFFRVFLFFIPLQQVLRIDRLLYRIFNLKVSFFLPRARLFLFFLTFTLFIRICFAFRDCIRTIVAMQTFFKLGRADISYLHPEKHETRKLAMRSARITRNSVP